uniref:Integrase zinc-binding domain-containing protein n=1 Tax=Knipowitschia caucasica TaxID=637954 RepID=A0AAV2LGC7_KNICA
MTVQIDKWVSECDKCQREGKPVAATAPLQNIKVSAVWELGREFVDELNSALCDLMHIERSITAAYHPQTNVLDVETNYNIKRALMKVVNDQQNNWDVYLEATLFSLRSKPQSSTEHTPFKLMYGREAVLPAEVPVDIPDYEEFVCKKCQKDLQNGVQL